MPDGQRHAYEELQGFNALTRLLHGNRYRHLKRLVDRLARDARGPLRVVDLGCGPCRAYEVLSDTSVDFTYLGIELRADFCRLARARHGAKPNFRIIKGSMADHLDRFDGADLILALETLEHVPEPLVVRVVEAIGRAQFGHLYVSVPNEVGPVLLAKNIGSWAMRYPRHREYTWRETLHAGFYDLDGVRRHDVGHRGFDWRWLAQTLRQNLRIVETTTSPVPLMPRTLSPSIGFICTPAPDAAARHAKLALDPGL